MDTEKPKQIPTSVREKLDKIIELAKRGQGGEKESALRLAKRMCNQLGLNFNKEMGYEFTGTTSTTNDKPTA